MPRERPHTRDLRKGRVSLSGQIYLLTTVTKDRAPVFADFNLGRVVVNSMRFHAEEGFVESLAFVVMPDHLHWLTQLPAGESLERLMRSFKAYTSRRINLLRNGQKGSLWQAGYHDHALRQEEDIQQVARYIVANPLRAGLVEKLGDYPLWDAVWL